MSNRKSKLLCHLDLNYDGDVFCHLGCHPWRLLRKKSLQNFAGHLHCLDFCRTCHKNQQVSLASAECIINILTGNFHQKSEVRSGSGMFGWDSFVSLLFNTALVAQTFGIVLEIACPEKFTGHPIGLDLSCQGGRVLAYLPPLSLPAFFVSCLVIQLYSLIISTIIISIIIHNNLFRIARILAVKKMLTYR